MVMKDPLVGALPEQTNTASQPLTGLPSSMTGGVGTGMIPPQQSSGQSALAPVPSPGGNASVEGAPLSQNGANEPQGGAGANLNLVDDRDKPMPYWEGNIKKVGSKQAMQFMSDSLNGSSGQTGKFAEGDPEDIRRAGSNLNQSMGINTAKDEATVREDLVVKPMVNAIVGDVDQEVIDLDEGGARIVGTIINSSEAGTIDEAAIDDASKRAADELGLKGSEKKGFIGRTTTRMKKWWELGKDDPNTKEREDETVEVTRFMGGMSRQELGMFVFQWGGLLMANADKGFGAAAGMAGGGAMAGHQGREATAAKSALDAEEMGIKQQRADAATDTAAAVKTRADAYAEGVGAVRGGVGEWKREFYSSIGWSDEKIAQAAEGILTSEQLFDDVSRDLRTQREKAQGKETMNLPDNMRQKVTLPDGTKVPTADLTNAQIDDLAEAATKSSIEKRGALSPAREKAALPRDPADDFGSAMSQYGTTP